jgi:hypothetical protein
MYKTFRSENPKGGNCFKKRGFADVDLTKQDVRVWVEFEWLRIGSSGEIL